MHFQLPGPFIHSGALLTTLNNSSQVWLLISGSRLEVQQRRHLLEYQMSTAEINNRQEPKIHVRYINKIMQQLYLFTCILFVVFIY